MILQEDTKHAEEGSIQSSMALVPSGEAGTGIGFFRVKESDMAF